MTRARVVRKSREPLTVAGGWYPKARDLDIFINGVLLGDEEESMMLSYDGLDELGIEVKKSRDHLG